MNRCGDTTLLVALALGEQTILESLRSATRRHRATEPRSAAFARQDGARGTAQVRYQTTLVNTTCGERAAACSSTCPSRWILLAKDMFAQ